jgi:hypothetical protein
LRQLTDEGLLISDTPKAPVRLAFSATTATYWLPDLISKSRPEAFYVLI